MGTVPTGTCRHCLSGLVFKRVIKDEWDWIDDHGWRICPFSRDGRHYPEEPIEGIDY